MIKERTTYRQIARLVLVFFMQGIYCVADSQCTSISNMGIGVSDTSFCDFPAEVQFSSFASLDSSEIVLASHVSPWNFQQGFGFSFPTGNNGCHYILRFGGSVTLWGNMNHFDAYCKFNSVNNVMYAPPGLDMFLSPAADIAPNTYNPTHVYDYIYFGDGTTATFSFSDFPYWDNIGNVTFDWVVVPCFSYEWDFGDGQTSTDLHPSHSYAEPGTYQAILTITNDHSGCSNTISQAIYVHEPGQVQVAGVTDTICYSNDLLELIGSPSGGTFSGEGVVQNYFQPSTVGVGGPYQIYYEYVNEQGCTSGDSMITHVIALPEVELSGLENHYCLFDDSVIMVGAPAGGEFSGPGVEQGAFSPLLAGVGGPIAVDYIYTDPSGCSGSASHLVEVHDHPEVTLTGLSDGYCLLDEIDLLTGTPAGGEFSGAGVFENAFDPTALQSAGTTYAVYTYSNVFGCSGSDTAYTAIYGHPILTIENLLPAYCASDEAHVLHGTPEGGVWSGEGVEENMFSPSDANSDQWIELMYENQNVHGCSSALTAETIVHSLPQPDLGPDQMLCFPVIVELTPGTFDAYVWTDLSTDAKLQIKEAGTYSVQVTNAQGCSNFDEISLESDCTPPFYIPNAFSPDNDGINDSFFPVLEDFLVEEYEFKILNRWGQVIFQTSDIHARWDGGFGSTYVEPGVYVWSISFIGQDDAGIQLVFETGTVQVLR